MRTGSYAVQQGLTAEAAGIVKQAVTLAKRRGHAQVTPLHVANTMLAAADGLLRTACLQSHSHPLQCKALELCFNVALNRLPASNSSPMLGTRHSQSCPSVSNALVAAFKRAQAHQRRGSIENQQQPLLAVKIELEQLIISILDDPSVSRVMREAGFSSTQVKSNVEQAVSLEICSQNTVSTKSKENNTNNNNLTPSNHDPQPARENVGKALVSDPIRSEDISRVIDYLANQRRKNTVIVGECLASLEGVVRGVMENVEKGDVNDHEALRDVKFIPLSLSAFNHVSRVEVERKVEELKSLTKASHGEVFILYTEDLQWLFEYIDRSNLQQGRAHYCPVEHLIIEIGKLVNGVGENGSICVMGIVTFQVYKRCKNGHPSLETLWGLHPLTIPAGSLRLSLITDSDLQNQSTNKKADNGTSWLLLHGGGDEKQQPSCFAEPSADFETEVRSLPSSARNSESSTSSLPAWLQLCKNENRAVYSNAQNGVPVGDLYKKWNPMCNSMQKQSYSYEKTLTFSSASPSSSTSCFSYDQQHPNLHHSYHDWPVVEPSQSPREHPFWNISESGKKPNEPILRMYIPEPQGSRQPFSSSNSNPNSTSCCDVLDTEYVSKFKELNSKKLKTLCNALEKKIPWQKDIIPEIVSTILQCRSDMLRRKGKMIRNSDVKEETWLFFQGVDMEAKEIIARELARVVFGSQSNLISIALSSFSSTRADSTEDCRNKRSRDEQSCSYIERFADAVCSNPHRVFLVEDIEQADYYSQMGFKRAIERGRVAVSNGEVSLSDAIIILSCESFSSRSRACSPQVNAKSSETRQEEENNVTLEETRPCVSLDLNICLDDYCDVCG